MLLRDPEKMSLEDKSIYEKMFAAVTPKGPDQLPLSRMNMSGLGKYMLVEMMEDSSTPQLADFLQGARKKGVTFYACKLSLEVMGLNPEELLPEVKVIDVKEYLQDAVTADLELFI